MGVCGRGEDGDGPKLAAIADRGCQPLPEIATPTGTGDRRGRRRVLSSEPVPQQARLMQPLSVQPLLDTAAGAPPGAPSSEAGGTGGAPRVGDLEARLAALGGAETAERVDALNALAYALPRAEAGRRGALASEARALAERLGYAAGYAAATAMTGYARLDQADPLAAVHLLREAERHEGLLPERVAFWVQAGLAEAHSALGDFEGVLRTLSALLDRVRAAGDRELEAWTLHGLSTAAADLGDAANGLALGTEALDAFTALGHEGGRTWAHGAVG